MMARKSWCIFLQEIMKEKKESNLAPIGNIDIYSLLKINDVIQLQPSSFVIPFCEHNNINKGHYT